MMLIARCPNRLLELMCNRGAELPGGPRGALRLSGVACPIAEGRLGGREIPGIDRSQQDGHRLQSIHGVPSTNERVLPETTIYLAVLGGLNRLPTAPRCDQDGAKTMKAIQYRSYGDYTEKPLR